MSKKNNSSGKSSVETPSHTQSSHKKNSSVDTSGKTHDSTHVHKKGISVSELRQSPIRYDYDPQDAYALSFQNYASGEAKQNELPYADQAQCTITDRDPLKIIDEQIQGRVEDLIPVRNERMLQSAFAFYRGNSALMAYDLARATPNTGLQVLSSGDAHISNFGLYASPERTLMFDLNDFDEAAFAPWEWDLKRMAASVVIQGQEAHKNAKKLKKTVKKAVKAYRKTIKEMVKQPITDRYFTKVTVEDLFNNAQSKSIKKGIVKTAGSAQKHTSERLVEKITVTDDNGQARLIPNPPTLVPITNLISNFSEHFERYLASLHPDAENALRQYQVVDAAQRIVGVGSVGTRCMIVLLEAVHGETLVLQLKEVNKSVLETFGKMGKNALPDSLPQGRGRESQRVWSGQLTLQAQSDPFLGYSSFGDHDYYWRQFRDMKGSVDVDSLSMKQFTAYARICGALLARAHAQSAQADAVAGYLNGEGKDFDKAITSFAYAYSEQNAKDYKIFQKAARNGDIPVAVTNS